MEDHAHSFAQTMPVKTRDLHSHHFDSTFWDDIRFRDDDIVIATYAKSGARGDHPAWRSDSQPVDL